MITDDDNSLSPTDVEIVRLIAQIIASISMLSSLVVFGLYWFFKEIRQIALELVVWLCVSVFFFSLSSFLPYSQTDDGFWCAMQSYMITGFQNSSIVWCGVIGYTAYLGVNEPSKLESNEKKYRILFILLALVLPLALSSIVLITEAYGPSGCWCWLKIKDGSGISTVLFIVYYLFAWSMIIVNCFFFYKVITKVRREITNESDIELVHKFTTKLKWYPIVQVLCLIPGTINRIYNFASGNQSLALTILQTIFDYSSGLMFALVYGLNPTIIRAICSCFTICCCRRRSRNSRLTEDLNVSRDKENNSDRSNSKNNKTYLSSVSDSRI